jgi:hypothetical protein
VARNSALFRAMRESEGEAESTFITCKGPHGLARRPKTFTHIMQQLKCDQAKPECGDKALHGQSIQRFQRDLPDTNVTCTNTLCSILIFIKA